MGLNHPLNTRVKSPINKKAGHYPNWGAPKIREKIIKKYPDVKHYTTEVYADQVYFGESKKNEGNNNTSTFQPPRQEAPRIPDDTNTSIAIGNLSDFEEIIGDDDLPF